jgi:hypothetical protein
VTARTFFCKKEHHSL